jgi:hypothetical protein
MEDLVIGRADRGKGELRVVKVTQRAGVDRQPKPAENGSVEGTTCPFPTISGTTKKQRGRILGNSGLIKAH